MKSLAIRFCLCCIAIGAGLISNAQNQIEPPKLAIKWSMPHLLYFYPSIQIGVEHRLLKDLSAQYDLGWVLDLNTNKSESYQNKEGFRGIAEIRYYVPSPPKVPFYIAGEFYYSRISFNRSQVIGYDCVGGECSYFEYVTYKVKNDHQGVGLKYGMLLFPGWNRNRSFFFDINGGIAYRTIAYHHLREPFSTGIEYFENDNSRLFVPSEKDRSEFRPVLGIRFGYVFF